MFLGLYAALLKKGWSMRDIDEMDVHYYLRVMAYEARGGRDALRTDEDGQNFIDDVWPV